MVLNMNVSGIVSTNSYYLEEDGKGYLIDAPDGIGSWIGKMKHLYAKNLSILLQKELGITRDDIYSLRVHDKYSFITMSEENCDKAIEKINGMDINGRTAQINYSTK